MNQFKQVNMGFAWYRRDQWDLLRLYSADGDQLEPTYQEWETSASMGIQEFRSRGLHPIRIDVDVHELVRWCKEQKIPVDGDARARYVSEQMI